MNETEREPQRERDLVSELHASRIQYGEDIGPWLCVITRLDEIVGLLRDIKRHE